MILFFCVWAAGAAGSQDDADTLGTVVGWFWGMLTFLLGLFVNSSVARFNSVRMDCVGGLWGAVDDLCLLSTALLPGPGLAKTRQTMVRWGVLSMALMFKQGSGEDSAASDLHEEYQAGLVTDKERAILGRLSSKSQVVWAWIAGTFSDCCARRLHLDEYCST